MISHDGPESFEEANAAYRASDRRKTLGLDPGNYLVDEETWEVEQTLGVPAAREQVGSPLVVGERAEHSGTGSGAQATTPTRFSWPLSTRGRLVPARSQISTIITNY